MSAETNQTDMSKLRRFLVTGTDGALYNVAEEGLDQVNAQCIEHLLQEDKGMDVVNEAVLYMQERRTNRWMPAIFALAMCARKTSDLKTKQAAYSAMQSVCTSPDYVLQFVDFCEKLSGDKSGWGRAQRRAIALWYNSKEPLWLAEAVTGCVQRNGWAHKDLLRLAHVKAESAGIFWLIFTYYNKKVFHQTWKVHQHKLFTNNYRVLCVHCKLLTIQYCKMFL